MGTAHNICTRVGPKHQDHCKGNWKVTPLNGKKNKNWFGRQSSKYHLDIVEVSSTKCCGSDTVELNKSWKLFYLDVDVTMSAQAGLGIFVSPHLAQCATDWIPFELPEQSLCILQVYTPNAEAQFSLSYMK